MTTSEFLRCLNDKKNIVIFGSGFAAEMFCRALEECGLSGKLRAVFVTKASPGESFHGVPVLSWSPELLTEEDALCAAVHESNLAGIPCRDHPACLFVYPHMHDMLYGKPLFRRCRASLAAVLGNQPEDWYWLAVRYAGIKGLEEGDDRLTELYLRTISLHTSRATAEKRLLLFRDLIRSVKERGLDPEKPILIDDSFRVIDGLHRLACASYFRLNAAFFNIYKTSPIYDEVLTEKNKLTEKFLLEKGIREEDFGLLRAVKKEMEERIHE